jgi:transcriptional regulator with XRE-family HTH domain
MTLLRTHLGAALRSARIEQGRTLRDVAKSAKVSLGYLSEVERGHKEASSELLNAISSALNLSLTSIISNVLASVQAGEQVVENTTPAIALISEIAIDKAA